jgi:chromosome segregation ATPase
MSGAEMLMLVALGFAVASLLALVIARGLWSFAKRLHRRRMRAEVPHTIATLKAERASLLADHAMQVRKTEVRLAEMKARLAEQAAEVARHRNRFELMAKAAADREVAFKAREEEARELRDQIGPLEAELAKRTIANQSLAEQLRQREETIARLTREISDLKEIVSEQELELAEFERKEPVPISPPIFGSAERAGAHERLSHRIDDLAALSREIAEQREQLTRERDELSALRQSMSAGDAGAEPERISEAAQVIEDRGREIEEKLAAAERESVALASELDSLDNLSPEKTFETSRPADAMPDSPVAEGEIGEEGPRSRPAGNVVSLAARIRALQRDSAS